MQPEQTSPPDAPGAAFYRTLVERCVRGVVETLGEGDVEALVLIGAPARGEPTVAETDAGPYSLSDVDLACFVRRDADVSTLRALARRWVIGANESLAPVCSGVDVSVRRRGDSRHFRPFISTFEMLRSPSVVWGDASILEEFPKIAIEDVPAHDSLTLLHNRVVEGVILRRRLTRPAGSMSEALSALYTSCKLSLDAVTAFLFLEQDVPERYVDRARAFAYRILNRPENDPIRVELAGYLPDIEALARFKASGDAAALAAAFGESADVPGIAAAARRCLREHAGLVETMWRLILEHVSGGKVVGEELDAAAALYSRLEPFPRKVVRALRMLRSPAGRAGLFSARRVFALTPFASPKLLAYVTAVVTYLEAEGRAGGDSAGPIVRRYCPFSLPRGFRRLEAGERLEVLADKLDLFLHAVLHGREVAPGR